MTFNNNNNYDNIYVLITNINRRDMVLVRRKSAIQNFGVIYVRMLYQV